MGLSEVDLQGYDVPTAETIEDLQKVYTQLCNEIYDTRFAIERVYTELDALEQIDSRSNEKIVFHEVQSLQREDWRRMDADTLRAEIGKLEQVHRDAMDVLKGLESAATGLANSSEKMAV